MSLVKIRSGLEADVPALNEIYNHYVRTTAITFDVEPSTVEQRLAWFRQFDERGRLRIVVAESAGELIGYAATLPFRAKAAYRTSVETTIYLKPDAGARGTGTSLYRELFARIQGEDLHRVLAGITLPNPASIALHLGFGFRSIGVFSQVGHKFGRYWDVQWFERDLG